MRMPSRSEAKLAIDRAPSRASVEAVDSPALLSTVPAGPHDRRLAFAVIIISATLFVATVPFVRLALPKVPAFIPAYEAALAINDLITAALLFGQFARLRSRALLTLACGYLFSALIIIPHALTFPDAFSATGLLGAGEQTTAWLYVFWHAGFPLFVLGYALLRNRGTAAEVAHGDVRVTMTLLVICVIATVVAFTLLATWGMDLLPVLIQRGDYSRLISTGASPSILILCLLALVALWRQRQPTVLEIWLMVVMCAWIFDVILSAVISSSRYDLGWYAGRSYGLLAASFVLVILLLETNSLHGRLARAQALLADRARELERRVRERTDELRRSNDSLKLEVTDREHAEKELLRTRAFLDVIIESIPAMLLVKDARDGKCILLNRAGEELLGCNRSDVIGKNVQDFMPMDQKVLTNTLDRPGQSSDDPYNVYEHTLATRSKGARLVRTKRVPMADEHGHAKYYLRFTEDITDQRQIEDQLRQAQKMEAIGQLTGGLAHDFNNLLAVVIGNIDLLIQMGGISPEKDELVQDALGAALSGSELTRRLLAFARQQPLQPERIELNELVSGISKLLGRTLGANVEIKLDLNASISTIVADRIQLETALTNLANNARDAMPDGGHLIISTRHGVLDEDYAAQHAEVEPGNYVVIEVTDTGDGMSPEILNRIFEPFYTTKGLGKGTGLGLSMVFGFIKQSGGHINVYSELGRGTTFRLYLRPAEANSFKLDIEAPPLQPIRNSGETILVVEDNAKLREIVVKQLTGFGFNVIDVDNAQAALGVLETKHSVDLLFTDIVLPGNMDGFALAQQVTVQYPDIKILLTSGFPGTRLPDARELGTSVRLLSKPYRKDELASAVNEVLAHGGECAPPPRTSNHAVDAL